eukprot:TRINITY_DN4292_c0_g1_i4.p1 TRINITY_DN4292_c0_g1~~TRINITY_DN4292_c0_g1_i4.p1  ORF type:complete len:108 (+),score=20.31 TRINITY_DN4292_c0_g1_i4:597-920(+)
MDYTQTVKKSEPAPPQYYQNYATPQQKSIYTDRFTSLRYMNVKTQKRYEIKCFLDDELEIPPGLDNKTISHACDNDVSSDDDQIRRGIKHMFTSLQEAVCREKVCNR